MRLVSGCAGWKSGRADWAMTERSKGIGLSKEKMVSGPHLHALLKTESGICAGRAAPEITTQMMPQREGRDHRGPFRSVWASPGGRPQGRGARGGGGWTRRPRCRGDGTAPVPPSPLCAQGYALSVLSVFSVLSSTRSICSRRRATCSTGRATCSASDMAVIITMLVYDGGSRSTSPLAAYSLTTSFISTMTWQPGREWTA